MAGPSDAESRSRQAGREAVFPGLLKGLPPPRRAFGLNFRSFMGALVSRVPEYGNLDVSRCHFSCSRRLTLPRRFAHKRAPPLPPFSGLSRSSRLMAVSVRRQGPVRLCCRRAGECPEWQRELTVNQPPHGFAGSSPASPTSADPIAKLETDAERLCSCDVP